MTETRPNPKRGERWRHCKGTLYEIVDHAIHTESEETLVLYQRAEDPRGPIWARPLAMFMDRHSSGAWRFEFVPLIERLSRDELESERARLQGLLDKWLMPEERQAATRESLARIEARLAVMA